MIRVTRIAVGIIGLMIALYGAATNTFFIVGVGSFMVGICLAFRD